MTTHELETGQTVMVDVVPRNATELLLDREGHLLSYIVEGGPMAIHLGIHDFSDAELVGTIQHPGVFSFDPKILGYKCKRWDRDDPYWQPEKSEQELMLADVKSWGYYWDNPVKRTSISDEAWESYGLSAWSEAESRKLSVEQMVVVILIKKV